MILTNCFCSVIIVDIRFVGDCFLEVLVMSNFYGKRFLSSLLGALSVLSSPVASAGKNELGRGDLGEGVHSSSRDKNNGNLGELKSNREVKSVDGLKKVLKETGGKVVRVSPDGKGGFVAFVKTPTGKVVTVAIVGVPLLVVLGLVARYVFSGRKNDGSGEKNAEIVFKDVSGGLLTDLFESNQGKYDSFVERLFKDFFDDASFREEFGNCERNLDKFLKVVFAKSLFGGTSDNSWKVGLLCPATVFWLEIGATVIGFGSVGCSDFFRDVFGYLSKNSENSENFFVKFKDNEQASWGDKISAVLFGFWFLAEYNLNPNSPEFKGFLKTENLGRFKEKFKTISKYVEDCLKAAGKGYNGQELV